MLKGHFPIFNLHLLYLVFKVILILIYVYYWHYLNEVINIEIYLLCFMVKL